MEKLEIKLKESDLETLWVVIYYYVDELYQQVKHLVKRPGSRPKLSDSEVLTICIVGQMMSNSESARYTTFALLKIKVLRHIRQQKE